MRMSTSSPASMAALPSVPSVRIRASFASKLSFSSIHVTKPCVSESATLLVAQVGVAAIGSLLKHQATNVRRLTASVRATSTAVMRSFAAPVIRLFR